MKSWLFLSIIFSLTAIHATEPQQANTLHYPEILFTYNWQSTIMDIAGSIYYGTEVTNAHKAVLKLKLHQLKTAWEKNAPLLKNGRYL
jgi:hypothetical protein